MGRGRRRDPRIILTLVGLIMVSSVLFPTSAPPGTLDVTSIEVHKGRRSYGSVMRTKLDTDFAFLKLNVTAGENNA